MNEIEVFRRYRADRRRLELGGFHAERFDHLVRYTATNPGVEGLIAYTDLSAGLEVAQINEQIAYFRARRQDFEWKVYEFDRPANLQTLLQSQSFVPGEMETFMVCPLGLGGSTPRHERASWDIRVVDDEKGIRDVVAVQERVWGMDFDWLAGQLASRLRGDPESSIYCAYVGDQPIGTGWVDFPSGSEFAELHGGAVVEGWHGRRVYSELYRHRLTDAIGRGYRFLSVDAASLSRPILEKLGFHPVCTTIPLRYEVT